MKTAILLICGVLLGTLIGVYSGANFQALIGLVTENGAEGGAETGAKEADRNAPLYWVAPMDKNYRRDGPGLSPMGMDLVPVYAEDVSSDSSVTISPTVENNLGVKTAKARVGQLLRPINTIGTVQYDESRISHIHSRVEGWIEKLSISAQGDPVRKGQVLFELYSPALVSAQEEFLAAIRSRNRNLIKASRSRLIALGLTAEQTTALEKRKQVEQRVQYLATSDGFVKALNIRTGMYIKPATEVMSISSLDSVWVIGEVYERQAYQVTQGQSVELKISSRPGKTWYGSVNYVYPTLDEKSRTLPVRVRIANQDHILKPNMLVQLQIMDQDSADSLLIPRAALIKVGQQSRVVKALGDGRYQSVRVIHGHEGRLAEDPTPFVQILDGLESGDSVVTSAQFLIDSESNIDEELNRMAPAADAAGKTTSETDSSDSDTVSDSVITKGTIEKLMPEMSMITVTHEPIPAWDWPTMKMDFQVSDHVDLSRLSAGQEVQFKIEKLGDWDFKIIAIGEDPMPAMDHSLMDHSTMNHSTMNHSTMNHETMDHEAMDHSTMDHGAMKHDAMNSDKGVKP